MFIITGPSIDDILKQYETIRRFSPYKYCPPWHVIYLKKKKEARFYATEKSALNYIKKHKLTHNDAAVYSIENKK